jgi:ATP-dependent protease Clp ATPase subunit
MRPPLPPDTTNVLFNCGGGLRHSGGHHRQEALGRGGFGFGQVSENCQVSADGLLRKMKLEDLVAIRLISELLCNKAKDMQSRSTVIVARICG